MPEPRALAARPERVDPLPPTERGQASHRAGTKVSRPAGRMNFAAADPTLRFAEAGAGDGIRAERGAGDGIRTHDFNLGKVALYP
jgi:hypothetical protein